jgi:hemolysin activation/secretion protein
MLFDRGVIDPVSLLVIGGEWSVRAILEYEVFVPRGITLRVSIRRPVAFMFRFSKRRFFLQYELRLAPEPDKLVSYANV